MKLGNQKCLTSAMDTGMLSWTKSPVCSPRSKPLTADIGGSLRLPFGLNVSAEMYQKKLLEALENLQDVVCIAEDVIVHGKNDDDHGENVANFAMQGYRP